jgi:hypothetical protein
LYGAVHLLDDLGDCICRIDSHAHTAAKIRQLRAIQDRHAGRPPLLAIIASPNISL